MMCPAALFDAPRCPPRPSIGSYVHNCIAYNVVSCKKCGAEDTSSTDVADNGQIVKIHNRTTPRDHDDHDVRDLRL